MRDEDTAERAPRTPPDRLRHWRRSRAGRLGITGGAILTVFALTALAAPFIAPYHPSAGVGLPYTAPSWEHLLGTNDVGHDVFSELVLGTRVSLTVGVLAALIAVIVGTLVGMSAGFFGGFVDAVFMRLVDLTLALPFLPLLIVLAAFLGQNFGITVLVIAFVIWARPARVIRSQVLSARERGHVQSALAMGAKTRHVLLRHLLPHVSPLIIAQFVRAANIAILIEASLSFLGLGDPTRKSWGTMLYYANTRGAFLTDAWLWWVLPTGLAISLVVLAFAFVGYALEEWADPRLRVAELPALTQFETARVTGSIPELREETSR